MSYGATNCIITNAAIKNLDKTMFSVHCYVIGNDAEKNMVSLSEIAQISAGYSFRGRIRDQAGTGIYAIQMKDVSEEFGLDAKSVVQTILPGKREPDWLQAGDILFVARGSRIFSTLYDGVFKTAVASPHFFVIRITNQNVLPEFISWQLNQIPAQRYFDKEAEGSVAKSIKRTALDKTPVSLPDIQRQQTILKLHKNIYEQKLIHRELIKNADKLMKDVALNLNKPWNMTLLVSKK